LHGWVNMMTWHGGANVDSSFGCIWRVWGLDQIRESICISLVFQLNFMCVSLGFHVGCIYKEFHLHFTPLSSHFPSLPWLYKEKRRERKEREEKRKKKKDKKKEKKERVLQRDPRLGARGSHPKLGGLASKDPFQDFFSPNHLALTIQGKFSPLAYVLPMFFDV